MDNDTDPDDLDQTDDGGPPTRMPYPVKVAAFLLGTLAVFAGFASIANTIGDTGRTHAVVFLGTVALAAVVAVVGLFRARRWGSYLGFGVALLVALATLRTVGTAVVGIGFLAAIMGTLMTRSAKDWLGFA
ncbi:hypothetical protein O7626_40520 [Micromonospora sp. WMMD1102]|uniref:hypothetical protein n=1 Tax=Micromonospora sp. WMMD1102 TaxID=3016105 RepID=UPI0024151CBC|nr:hypothetical protein [Micromonospora sp. WMMD1102]MDG4792102.1 hypothetical protein [Micromonospora sp. WMMD1102]